MVLGLVLGRVVEETFVNSMIKSNGSLLAFFERPLAATLGILTLTAWLTPLVMSLLRRRERPAAEAPPG